MVTAAEVLSRLKALGIRAEVRSGRLITRRPKDVAVPPDLAEAIRAHRAEIIRLLTESAAPDRCPCCGAELSAEDLEKFGGCPRCRKTLPGWEDAPHPAGVVAVPKEPDPAALGRAIERLKAELGDLTGREADLRLAVLEAAGRGWPWPFGGLEEAERAALLAWAVSPDKVLALKEPSP
jgi:predicted Zn-ribbon and HTH transcriptional regulator